MTIKSTRAPRKTKLADAIDVPFKEVKPAPSFFDQIKIDEGYPDISTKRLVAGFFVSVLSGFAVGYLVIGPLLNAFVVGAMSLAWPAFIILMGYILLFALGIHFGSKLCVLPTRAVLNGSFDAMYFVARDKVAGLFNFRKEVTA